MTFQRVFEGRTSRGEILGLFLALLELVRQKKILASQDHSFGTIHILLNPNPPADGEQAEGGEDQPLADRPRAAPAPAAAEATSTAPAPGDGAGTYGPEGPRGPGGSDDAGREPSEAGA